MHDVLTVDVMPELKKNVLNFGYGVNFKYEGMLTHSFDRFYVVAKYEIPKIENLKFTTFSFDLMCNHDIKENCDFYYYHNRTDVTPSVLDGGMKIILAN